MATTEFRDVVCVGGGVGGCAAAAVLARNGLDVLVLEREVEFHDRVRGEFLAPWGVGEAMALGLWPALERVEYSTFNTEMVRFDELVPPEIAAANPASQGGLVPGVAGAFSVSHVGLQNSLLAEAVECGAEVVRGAVVVAFGEGGDPSVSYLLDDALHVVRAKVVLGVDGRQSRLRQHLGIELDATEPRLNLGGMLVDGVHEWPSHRSALGIEGDRHFLIFPQRDGRMRLYAAWDHADTHRLSGPDRQARFLDMFRLDCVPGSDEIAGATPIGPCASMPMTDAWSDVISRNGYVLVGDAAGWSDPTIGQGLSVTFRDVHMVTDALLGSNVWDGDTFREYAEERTERMRRLRVAMAAAGLLYRFDDDGRERRKRIGRWLAQNPGGAPSAAAIIGPWRMPADVMTDDVVATMAAL